MWVCTSDPTVPPSSFGRPRTVCPAQSPPVHPPGTVRRKRRRPVHGLRFVWQTTRPCGTLLLCKDLRAIHGSRKVAVNRAVDWLLQAAVLALPLVASGPVDAGRAEVRRALDAGRLPDTRFSHAVEQSMALPLESFQIQGAMIRGGSPRALLYALIEASESIASKGSISSAAGQAQLAIRGVRRTVSAADLGLPLSDWQSWFRQLALARFNRARLIFPSEAGPPHGLLRLVTDLADQYALDLSIQLDSMALDSLPELLRISPTLRAVYASPEQSAAVSKAVSEAGRYVMVETVPGVRVPSAVPSRVLAHWRPGSGRPCPAGCEFVWLLGDGASPTSGLLDSGAAGFEIDHTRLAAWSGFGYAVKQGALPSAKKAATGRRSIKKPASKTTRKKTTTRKR